MTKETIENYWNNFFGIKEEALNEAIIVVPHHYLDDYNGAWIFQRKNQTILSVKPILLHPIKNKLNNQQFDEAQLFSKPFVEYLFGKSIERVIGPVYQGYYDNIETVFQIKKNVALVNYQKDKRLIDKLSKSGDEKGWVDSGVNADNDAIYGYFYEDQIASIGCYNIIRGDIGFVGVYTNPKYRGMGFNSEVVKKIVNELSKRKMIIRYQTLKSNKPSVRIAEKIGFKEYAINMAIRLKNENGGSRQG